MTPEVTQQAIQQTTNDFVYLYVSLFVIVPLLFFFVGAFVLIAIRRKCPTCGSKRYNRKAIQTIKENNVAFTKRVVICSKDNTVLV